MSAAAIRAWLLRHTPLAEDLLAGRAFEETIRARRIALGDGDERAYLRRLEADADESIRLQVAFAVPETWLFRYRASFDWLRGHLLGLRAAGLTSLRVLCAPCARGAEAYSMAATAAAAEFTFAAIEVTAIDLAESHLEVARRGVAPLSALRESMPEWASSFFVADPRNGVALRPELLARIRFVQADLVAAADPIAGTFDVVACRNLLIYLGRGARERLVERLRRWTSSEGVLLVGHADAAGVLSARFETVDHRAFAWRPRASAAVPRRAAEGGGTTSQRYLPRSEAPAEARAGVPARPRDAVTAPESSRPAATTKIASGEPRGGRSGAAGAPPDRDGAERTFRAALASGRPAEVVAAAEALLRIKPDAVDALLALARVRLPDDRSGAESLYRRALYLEPGCEPALLGLATLLDHDGRHAEAERLRRRALRTHLASAERAADAETR